MALVSQWMNFHYRDINEVTSYINKVNYPITKVTFVYISSFCNCCVCFFVIAVRYGVLALAKLRLKLCLSAQFKEQQKEQHMTAEYKRRCNIKVTSFLLLYIYAHIGLLWTLDLWDSSSTPWTHRLLHTSNTVAITTAGWLLLWRLYL